MICIPQTLRPKLPRDYVGLTFQKISYEPKVHYFDTLFGAVSPLGSEAVPKEKFADESTCAEESTCD
jgi:hypothetical protein